jgi:hypothetical protein
MQQFYLRSQEFFDQTSRDGDESLLAPEGSGVIIVSPGSPSGKRIHLSLD